MDISPKFPAFMSLLERIKYSSSSDFRQRNSGEASILHGEDCPLQGTIIKVEGELSGRDSQEECMRRAQEEVESGYGFIPIDSPSNRYGKRMRINEMTESPTHPNSCK